jgi:hypothetical protein
MRPRGFAFNLRRYRLCRERKSINTESCILVSNSWIFWLCFYATLCYLVPAAIIKLNYSFVAKFWIVCVCREPLKSQKPKKLETMLLEFHVLNTPDLETIAILYKMRTFLDKSNICFAYLNHILSLIWMCGCRQSWTFCSILFPL